MNNSLVAIADVLVNTVNNGPASSKYEAPKNTSPFTLNSADKSGAANTTPAPETTTDNIIAGDIQHGKMGKSSTTYTDIPSDKSSHGQSTTGKPSQNISYSPVKKTVSQKAYENNKEKPKTDDLTTSTFLLGNLSNPAKTQESSTDNLLLGKNIATGINSPSQQQEISKSIGKPIQLTKNTHEKTSKPILSGIYEKQTIADKKALTSNKEAVSTKDLSSQNSKIGILAGQTADASAKSSASSLYTDSGVGLVRNINEKIVSKQNSPKQSATGGSTYLAGSANPKKHVLDFSQLQDKPAGSMQKLSNNTEKSTFIAEKSTAPSVFTPVPSTSSGQALSRAEGKELNDTTNTKATLESLKKTKPVPSTSSGQALSRVEGNESPNNQEGNFSIQKPSLAEFEVSTSQKNLDSSKSYNSSNSNLEGMFSSNNTHSFVPEQLLDSTKVINITNPQGQTSPSGISGSVGEQIIESMRASLNEVDLPRQIMVRLEPPELGNILVRFQEQEDEITGLLEFSKPETKYEIEHTLPQIIRTLADCGVQIKRLDVHLSDQFEPNADRTLTEGNLENGLFQHQHSAEGGDPDGNGEEWLTNSSKFSYHSYYDDSESQLIVNSESINMLI
jgi:flagellar hook-length control protein FliK